MKNKIDFRYCVERVNQRINDANLSENLFFVSTYNDFLRNIKLLNNAYKSKEYEVCEKLSIANSKIALNLFKMLDDEEAIHHVKKQNNVCPDFSKLPPQKLRSWCKHFDIDPSDYSKEYLYKALEKRWKFENE